MTFTEAKQKFDAKYGSAKEIQAFLPEHLTMNKTVNLRKVDGTKNEQYYKWQFLSAIVNAGLFPNDLIGTEVHFPKGNKASSYLILDAAIFDDAVWFDKYNEKSLFLSDRFWVFFDLYMEGWAEQMGREKKNINILTHIIYGITY